MKKIAFLILAHIDVEQLHRLIYALDDNRFDIYVHIDKKKNLDEFNLNRILMKDGHLYVCPERYRVIWGDISIVDATLAMYAQARKNFDYTRYVTLSGLDYPIMSNDQLYSELCESATEFMGGALLEDSAFMRVDWPFFWRNPLCFQISRHIVGNKLAYRIITMLRRNKHKSLQIDGRNAMIYFAPQWHALSGDFVKYMLDILRRNPQIYSYFKHSFAPDEMLIPTILFNSEYSNYASTFSIKQHYNDMAVTHYLNYDAKVQIFDESRCDDIINSKKMFVRKISGKKSEKLVSMLNEYRRGKV